MHLETVYASEGGFGWERLKRYTGEVERKNESYGDGPASHTGPESCMTVARIGVKR